MLQEGITDSISFSFEDGLKHSVSKNSLKQLVSFCVVLLESWLANFWELARPLELLILYLKRNERQQLNSSLIKYNLALVWRLGR